MWEQEQRLVHPAAPGVQIAGVNHREGGRVLNPSAQEMLGADDELLVLGTPVQIRDFKLWLQEQLDESAGAD